MEPKLQIVNVTPNPVVVRAWRICEGLGDELKQELLLRPVDEIDLGNFLKEAGTYRIVYHHATLTPEQKDSGRFNRGVWLGTPGDPNASRPANPGYLLGEAFREYTITV